MYKCPKCEEEMIWQTDEEDEDGVGYSYYACSTCHIDLFEHWGRDE